MALSAATALTLRNREGMRRYTFTILTGAVIYKHAMVVMTAAGVVKPAADETTTRFVGIAERTCDTGDGTVTCTVFNNVEALMPMVTAITVGDTGVTKLYAADDQTITSEATLGPEVGVMVQYAASLSGWIAFRSGTIVKAS